MVDLRTSISRKGTAESLISLSETLDFGINVLNAEISSGDGNSEPTLNKKFYKVKGTKIEIVNELNAGEELHILNRLKDGAIVDSYVLPNKCVKFEEMGKGEFN